MQSALELLLALFAWIDWRRNSSSQAAPRMAQAQQPLARVVVGGMITTVLAVLFVLPLFARRRPGARFNQFATSPEPEELRV